MKTIDRETLEGLRREYGEAFYLLDSHQFRLNFEELRAAFRRQYAEANIAYSYKTNYTPRLCAIVNEMGGLAEVVSEMELEIARRVGVPPERIIWNGPIKQPEALEAFLLAGGTCNLDSADELSIVRDIARRHPRARLHLGLRCNYDVGDGVVSRFGFDTDGEAFAEALHFVTHTPNVVFRNFQCHFAKRQLDYWPARAEGMLRLVERTGVVPERIDIGGGLYGKMDETLRAQFPTAIPTYDDYARAAAAPFAECFKGSARRPELLIEPGSALVGDCMMFVGTVKTVKRVRGRWMATVLGSQKNISMGGVNPPVQVVAMGGTATEYDSIDLVGFTCIEGDVLYRGYRGPLAKGDAVVVGNCGSYSLVMKPPFILPNFPVIDIGEGRTELIKRGETFDDLFHTFTFQ